MVSSLDPRYSPTPLPGYVVNNPWAPGPNGAVPTGVNHPAWQTNVITALAVDWASGGRGLPGGWNDSFGLPNPADTNGKPTAGTISAFTKYIQAYKPGQSEWIDANYPYVPPGPGDYVESSDTIALRVAQENWEKQFDVQFGPGAQAEKAAALEFEKYRFEEGLKLDKIKLANDTSAQASQAAAQASQAAYQMASLSIQKEGMAADEAWRKAQMELEREKLRVGEDQFNKTLALQYENLWLAKEEQADRRALAVADIQQKRANTLAELGADPGDAVQREFFSRLGTEPLGTPVDVFTGQAGATDSRTLSQVMAGQADKLRPFAQRGFSGSPVNTQSGLVTDPVSVVGDNPSGQPSGTEEILLNPTQAPFGVVSNKDVKKMGLRDVVRGARVPRHAEGTYGAPTSPVGPFTRGGVSPGGGDFGSGPMAPPAPPREMPYGEDNRMYPQPVEPVPTFPPNSEARRFSDMFRDRMVKGAGYFGVTPDRIPTYPRQMPANMTLPVMPTPRPAGQKFSDFAAMARGRWQDALGRVPRYAEGTGFESAPFGDGLGPLVVLPDGRVGHDPNYIPKPKTVPAAPTVTPQDIGSVAQVEPVVKPAPAATPAPKWNLVTTPAGGAVWYDGTSGKYYDPNTKAEIPSPAGMTKGVPDPITVPAATPPTPPAWNPRPGESYSAPNGDQWQVMNGRWIYYGNDPKIPPSKIPTTTPGNPNALTPYWGGWWDMRNGPVPQATPVMGGMASIPREGLPIWAKYRPNADIIDSSLFAKGAKVNNGWATYGDYPLGSQVPMGQRIDMTSRAWILNHANRDRPGSGFREGPNDTRVPITTLSSGEVIGPDGRRIPKPAGWPADAPWPPVRGENGLPPPAGGGPLPPPPGTTQPPPAGGGATPPASGSTGNALLDALAQSAGIDILSYGPEVYQALARLLNQPGIAEQLAANGINVPALGLTGGNALPAPNALNYTNLSDLSNNAPGSFALLSSLFKAGNQNLPNLMAGVKARAPLGSAYNPSLIST